jgi:hypothetical protein
VYQFDELQMHPDSSYPPADGYVVILLLGLLFKISFVFATLGLLVCLPINILGDNGETGLQLLTAANVKDESYLFCVHAAVVLISVAAGAYFTKQTADRFNWWRRTQLKRSIPENYFALVRGINESAKTCYTPGDAGAKDNVSRDPVAMAHQLEARLPETTGLEHPSPKSSAPEHLHHKAQFQQARITAVTLFCKTEGEGELQELHTSKTEAIAMKEQAEAEWHLTQKEDAAATDADRPTHRHDGCLCCGGELVDTIKWWVP